MTPRLNNKLSDNRLEKNSLKFKQIDGVVFDPFKQEWKIDRDESVNYIIQFQKI